jgi:hypothetical protein
MDDENFYKTAHAFSVHLRAQANLITEMKCKCPNDTTRWLAFGKQLDWMLDRSICLLEHIESKRTVQAPLDVWWIMAAGVHLLYEMMNITMKSLQSLLLVLSQQRCEVKNLVSNLCSEIGICLVAEDRSYESLEMTECFLQGRFWLKFSSISEVIADEGSWARNLMASLPGVDQKRALSSIARFSIKLVDGLASVHAERDKNNEMASEEAPPVMPPELVTMRTAKFISDILDTYRDHVSRWWTAIEIKQIEKDHKKLGAECNGIVSVVKTKNDQHDHIMSFNSAWDDLKGQFEALRAFSGNLAAVFPSTTSIGSDFSILKWEKDGNRKAMTNLSVEGIFQARQRELIMSI